MARGRTDLARLEDFASRVDSLPQHAHAWPGQGYSDINFLIPELVDRIEYKKGTYYAEEGNLFAAGAVDVSYARKLDQSLAVLGTGSQLQGEADPVADIHFHPVEPRTLRAMVTVKF
jgi:hypothetical protein